MASYEVMGADSARRRRFAKLLVASAISPLALTLRAKRMYGKKWGHELKTTKAGKAFRLAQAAALGPLGLAVGAKRIYNI